MTINTRRTEQLQRIDSRNHEHLKEQPELAELRNKLLTIGGEAVVLQPEPHLDIILEHGKLWTQPVRLVRGAASRCHLNSVRLFIEAQKTAKLVCGWGLSDDGLWRQHSWICDRETLMETTVRRRLYYGADLTPMEAGEVATVELWQEFKQNQALKGRDYVIRRGHIDVLFSGKMRCSRCLAQWTPDVLAGGLYPCICLNCGANSEGGFSKKAGRT